MFISSSLGKIRRTSSQSEIKSILRKNSVAVRCAHSILIGSRAARHYLPNFRGIRHDPHADWNILSTSDFFLAWWEEQGERVKSMEMLMPKTKDGSKLDLSINCLMQNQSKYNFIIPRSSLTPSAYLLENSGDWIEKQPPWTKLIRKGNCITNASVKLLLILKRYMLHYAHQWTKTAGDYRELLTIAEPLPEEDEVLCDLLVQYNEKIYGKRQLDDRRVLDIDRDEFFQRKKNERIEFAYQIALSLPNGGDILIGLEYLCTQAPLWLADDVLNHWISIQNEKFQQKFPPFHPCINFDVDNPCLFSQLPANITQRILHHITDIVDFHSMQFVCKQWYALLHEESFWKDLYRSRYDAPTTTTWKMLYFIRMVGTLSDELVDSSADLRRCTGNDVLRLWEDLTHRAQRVDPLVLSRIDHILSNAFYYQLEQTPNQFSAKLLIDGCSPSRLHLSVHLNEYRTAQFADHTEYLLVGFQGNDKSEYSWKFLGPNLLGFDLDCLGYLPTESILFTATLSSAFPLGLLVCLFITMIHPLHRIPFIKYLLSLENHCSKNLCN